jgi:hypothetical protein
MSEKRPNLAVRWLGSGLAASLVMICGGGYFVYRKIPLFSDVPDTAGRLEENARKAKEAGVPFLASDLVPNPPVSDSQNAAHLLKAIGEKYHDEISTSASGGQSATAYTKMSDAIKNGDLPSARKKLRDYDGLMSMGRKAAEFPQCYFERDWDMGPNLMFPEFSQLKNLAKLFAVRAEFKALDGDHVGAVEDITTAAKLGSHAGSDPTIISLLVHVSIETICNRAIETSLGLCKTAEDFKPYVDYLENHDPKFDLKRPLDGEAYTGIAILRNRNVFGSLSQVASGDPTPEPIDPSKLKRDGLPSKMLDRAFLSRHFELWAAVYQK